MSETELGQAPAVPVVEQMDQADLEAEAGNGGRAPKDWTAADLAIKVVRAGSAGHARLLGKLEKENPRGFSHPSTTVYDAMALSYNQLGLEDAMILNLPTKPSTGNLKLIIKGRGLLPEDYHLYKPLCDEDGRKYPPADRPFILQRKSKVMMRSARKYPAEAAALARKAEQAGEQFDFIRGRPMGQEEIAQSKPTTPKRKGESTAQEGQAVPRVEPSPGPATPQEPQALRDIAPLGKPAAKKPGKHAQIEEPDKGLMEIPPIAANN